MTLLRDIETHAKSASEPNMCTQNDLRNTRADRARLACRVQRGDCCHYRMDFHGTGAQHHVDQLPAHRRGTRYLFDRRILDRPPGALRQSVLDLNQTGTAHVTRQLEFRWRPGGGRVRIPHLPLSDPGPDQVPGLTRWCDRPGPSGAGIECQEPCGSEKLAGLQRGSVASTCHTLF